MDDFLKDAKNVYFDEKSSSYFQKSKRCEDNIQDSKLNNF
jgi:hypothetical protein